MTTAVELARVTDYRALLLEIEPRTVTSEEQADSYLAVIDALTDCRPMSEGQREMVGLLGQLVYDWEAEHEEPITATPIEVLAMLLASNGLPQRALVGPVFPNPQAVSACLAGRRAITYDRAVKLGEFFHVSPAAFYRPS